MNAINGIGVFFSLSPSGSMHLLFKDFPGGAIFDRFNRFENAVVSDDVEQLLVRLLFVILALLLLANTLPVVECALDASNMAMRDLLLAAGTIFVPCTRFTWRAMPSGAIM